MSVRFPADLYYQYRPVYPDGLYRAIAEWLKVVGLEKSLSFADIGCGSGQATVGLIRSDFTKDLVKEIKAIEIDSDMLNAAQRRPEFRGLNIEFIACPGQDTRLADASVDVVLCASAFHWMPRDLAVKEFVRITRAPGLICLAEYAFPKSKNKSEFDHWILSQLLGPWEIPELRERKPFAERVDIFATQNGVRALDCRQIEMVRSLDWRDLIGLIQTQSRYVRFRDSLLDDTERLRFDQMVSSKTHELLGEEKVDFDFRLMAAGFARVP